MEKPEVQLQSTENDDTESTDSSLCIIMAEELDHCDKHNGPTFSLGANNAGEIKEIQNENEQNQIDQGEGTEDSFSAMTQSQYAQV